MWYVHLGITYGIGISMFSIAFLCVYIFDKEFKVEDIEHKIQRNKEIISDKQKTAEPLTQKQIINNFAAYCILAIILS